MKKDSKDQIHAPVMINPRAETAVLITKTAVKSNKREIELDYSNTSAVANSIFRRIENNEEILKLFPDVEISIQILVSSILSPNDLLMSKLVYSMDELGIPSNVNTQILEAIRNHIENNYKLDSKLSTILREALFTKGAYAEMFVPDVDIKKIQVASGETLSTESIISKMEMINKSNNNKRYLGIGTTAKLSLEAIYDTVDKATASIDVSSEDLDIVYTEDMSIMRAPEMFLEHLSTETSTVKTNTIKSSLRSIMRKRKETSSVITITSDNSSGSPMAMKLPVGSVLPIHITNDPSKHIAYIVLLDENGVPVSKPSNIDSLGSYNNSYSTSSNDDIKAKIISKAATALRGKTSKDIKLTNIDDIYTRALIADMQNRINSGRLGNIASIPEHSDVYNIVFTRALKGLKTRLLFVPKANMSYFAFEHRDNGTGKSMLEKSMMLFSIRAANLFTRLMANVKNSITTTKVSAVLDDADDDPEHTKELIINHAMKSERVKYPIGMTNVNDLVEWMHNVGYRFDIRHPSLPKIELEVSEEGRNVISPDTELDEMIEENIIMSFGLKKDMVRSGFDADFATTVVANNALFAKRIIDYHAQFNPQTTSYVRKIMRNDGILKERITDIIISNITSIRKMILKDLTDADRNIYKEYLDDDTNLADYVYSEYLSDIVVNLPRFNISREEGSTEGLRAFAEMLDEYLPMIISDETLPAELVGDLSDKMGDITTAIKTVLIKKWVDDHNFMPELTKFLTLDNTGKPRYDILEEYSDFSRTLSKVVIPYIKKLKKEAIKTDKTLDKIDNMDGTEEEEIEPTAGDARKGKSNYSDTYDPFYDPFFEE